MNKDQFKGKMENAKEQFKNKMENAKEHVKGASGGAIPAEKKADASIPMDRGKQAAGAPAEDVERDRAAAAQREREVEESDDE